MQTNPGMYPVGIDELMKQPTVSVNLYVRLSETKFVLVARAGANTPSDHLQKFKDKGVSYLYARVNDFQTLVMHSISVAGMTVGSKAVDNFSKLTVIEKALSSVNEEISRIGVDQQVLGHARLVVEASLTLVAGTTTLAALIQNYDSIKDGMSRHAMMVSMVATMLGQGHEWVKPATLEKLALGGMLHDIGKAKMPIELIDKSEDKMSHDEVIIYRSHPELGRQMLTGVRDIPDDVVLMVYEHHEHADGTGYPRALRDVSISPLSRVIALANAYVEAIERKGGKLTAQTARQALDDIEFKRSNQFNKDAMRVLRRLVDGEFIKKAV